jgi:hypothetical protein
MAVQGAVDEEATILRCHANRQRGAPDLLVQGIMSPTD